MREISDSLLIAYYRRIIAHVRGITTVLKIIDQCLFAELLIRANRVLFTRVIKVLSTRVNTLFTMFRAEAAVPREIVSYANRQQYTREKDRLKGRSTLRRQNLSPHLFSLNFFSLPSADQKHIGSGRSSGDKRQQKFNRPECAQHIAQVWL